MLINTKYIIYLIDFISQHIYEKKKSDKFLEILENNPEKKEELEELYHLSNKRGMKICAPNNEILKNIIIELKENGFLYE